MTPPPPPAGAGLADPPDPEYVAIILAATQGRRLYPLTSPATDAASGSASGVGTPKHLLPVSILNPDGEGASCPLVRLLVRAAECGIFGMCVVAVAAGDGTTAGRLVECGARRAGGADGDEPGGDGATDLAFGEARGRGMRVRVVRLPEDCHGRADALRFLSGGSGGGPGSRGSRGQRYIPRSSNAVVMPGDLILEGQLLRSLRSGGGGGGVPGAPADATCVLSRLVDAHRRWNAGGPSSPGAALTMVLADVGAEDKDGAPLKESSKAKLGLFSREEEDMDYVGLSSEAAPPLSGSLRHVRTSSHSPAHSARSAHNCPAIAMSRRVVMKRSKLEVEEDEGTGATPKAVLPKRRLHAYAAMTGSGPDTNMISSTASPDLDRSPSVTVRTDLNDFHLYALSAWVFDLIHARPSMQSLQNEVVPLLISRQYRGVEGAFGETSWRRDGGSRERLRGVLGGMDENGRSDPASDRGKVASLLGTYASGRGGAGPGPGLRPRPGGPASEDAGPDAGDAGGAGGPSVLGAPPPFPGTRHGYAVAAHVLSREESRLALRACTLPSLLHGCNAVTSAALKLGAADAAAAVADNARLAAKFNSVSLSGCEFGEKVQTKACTIGRDVVLGDRSRLNNVVVMDGATVGSNTVLQNSIVGAGARVGDNCSMKDCQVGPGAVVPSGTRTAEKGETFEA